MNKTHAAQLAGHPVPPMMPRMMKVHFTLRHSHTHPQHLRPFATAAVSELQKYFDGITDCRVVLDHQKHDKVHGKLAEITARVRNHIFVTRTAAESYEKAIQEGVMCIGRQLKKHKEKVKHL
ncbi:MAG: ribosome-associated translation inhibitor RaiA [Rhizobacter sp.]|nr:ribosome-associated translation inhibitor RaiA [Chlorobiales bacterium]